MAPKGEPDAGGAQDATPLDWLQSQLAERPEDSGLWYGKGVFLVKAGALDKALEAFERVLWLDPDHLKALEAKAKLLFRQERFLEAYDAFKRLTQKVPRDEEYWYYCGEALSRMGRSSKALAYYDRALDVNPNYTDAWYGKANALKMVAREGEEAKARRAAQQAGAPAAPAEGRPARRQGTEIEALLTRAESAYYDEDYDEALALYDMVLEREGRSPRAWEGKGRVMTRMGRYSEAAQCYERAIEREPGKAEVWLRRGKALREHGEVQEAAQSFQEALKIDPGSVEAAVELREVQAALEGPPSGEEGPREGEPSEDAAFATYLEAFDAATGGGLTPGSVVLVAGMPGTFKTSLCFWILYQRAIREARDGLFVTLEQSKPSLLRQAVSLGLQPAAAAEHLRILDLSKHRLRLQPKDSPHQWLEVLERKVEEVKAEGVDALVIDSLEALAALAGFRSRRRDVYRLFEHLRRLEMTTFVVTERYEVPLEGRYLRLYGPEDYLADGTLEIAMREREGGELVRALRVVKLRDRPHPMALHFLVWDDGFRMARALAAPPRSS